MRKLWQSAILIFMLFCTSICLAATLESEWKYVSSGQFEDGRKYNWYFNKNAVEYNAVNGLIEAKIALTYLSTDEKPIHLIMFRNVDYDTKKHMARYYGTKYEIDDKDLTFSKKALKSILNVGRYASALLIPFDGGFTTAFINGFTEVAGEDTAINTMSKLFNPSMKNQEDLREDNDFYVISPTNKDDNALYVTARSYAGLESEWWKTSSIKKFDSSAANMEFFRQGKTADDRFYIDKESVYFGKLPYSDGMHDMAVVVLCSNANCENDLERTTWALEICDLTLGTQKMISHYFVLESNIFIADTNGVMPLLCDTYSEDGTVNVKEWEKMKQLSKSRINPNFNYYNNLFDKEKLLKVCQEKYFKKVINDKYKSGTANNDAVLNEILKKIKEEKGL